MAVVTDAKQILNAVATTLQDPSGVHWPRTELLMYLNEAQVQIVNLKPEAYTVVSDQGLASGTRQQLPNQSMRLIEITRNLGADNSAVRVVSRVDMDTLQPNWHASKANDVVQHYMYDILEPTSYLVYPPQPDPAKGRVRMITSDIPAYLTSEDQWISLRDIFNPALINYTLHRAYAKDAEATANLHLKTLFWQQFQYSLGLQPSQVTGATPNG